MSDNFLSPGSFSHYAVLTSVIIYLYFRLLHFWIWALFIYHHNHQFNDWLSVEGWLHNWSHDQLSPYISIACQGLSFCEWPLQFTQYHWHTIFPLCLPPLLFINVVPYGMATGKIVDSYDISNWPSGSIGLFLVGSEIDCFLQSILFAVGQNF